MDVQRTRVMGRPRAVFFSLGRQMCSYPVVFTGQLLPNVIIVCVGPGRFRPQLHRSEMNPFFWHTLHFLLGALPWALILGGLFLFLVDQHGAAHRADGDSPLARESLNAPQPLAPGPASRPTRPYLDDETPGRILTAATDTMYRKLYWEYRVHGQKTRLLLVKPGSGEIQCEFKILDLGVSARYDALSYVWGDFKGGHYIRVHGVPFNITDNLYDALTELRRERFDVELLIWVDQLCINQRDKEEQSIQIPLMKEIYSRADRVIAWLGTGENRSLAAAVYFSSFDVIKASDNQLMSHWRKHSIIWNDFYAAFLSREWWTRAWIVQEVLLAKDPILQRGSDSLNFDTVLRLARFIDDYPFTMSGCTDSPDIISSIPLVEMQVFRERLRKGHKIPMDHWIVHFHNQDATKLQDKIFAFAGLANPDFLSKAFPRDLRRLRELSIAEVWCKAIREVLQETKCLDVLTVGCGSDRKKEFERRIQSGTMKNMPSLPSWVPDLCIRSATLQNRLLPLNFGGRTSSFNASWLPHDFPALVNWFVLLVQGVEVDSIKQVSRVNVMDHNFEAGDDQYDDGELGFVMEASSMTIALGLRDEKGRLKPYPGPGGGTYTDAIRRTLMMDLRYSGARLQPHEDIANLSVLPPSGFMPAVRSWAAQCKAWQTSLHAERNIWTHGRRFATTTKGYLAIVNAMARPGHIVCILNGASMPVILEKEDDYKYHFVGESYLHGFMDQEGKYLEHRMRTFMISEGADVLNDPAD